MTRRTRASTERQRTWTGRKSALIVLAGLLVVLAGLAAGLTFAFPAERVGTLAAERASAALDRDVGVERIRFKLWPAPAVALEGVTIARWRHSQGDRADPSTASQPLASIGRVEVRPRLLPLLRRSVVVHEVVIDRPVVVVEIDGTAEPVPESVREGTTGFWDEATLQIERIRVRDGSVEYRDVTTGNVVRVEDIDQELRLVGEVRDGELARLGLSGRISAGRINAEMPDRLAVPIQDLRVSLDHDAVLHLTTESATFDRMAVTVQEMTLEGSGTIDSWSDPAARRLSLRLETGDTELTPLLASLPANMRAWPAGAAASEEWTATAGRGSLQATIDGPLGDGELPVVVGSLGLDGVSLARGGDPIVTELGGQVAFSLDSVSSEGLTAQLFGEPLRLSFTVQEPAAPVVHARLVTGLNLARATALGLLPVGWSAGGLSNIDLAIAGPLAEPAAVALNGEVSLDGVAMEAPDWPAPVTVSAGSLKFGGAELVGQGLAATVGESDVTIDFALGDWLPFAFGEPDAVPRLAFESRSGLLDADALFPTDPAEPTYTELFLARLMNTQVGERSAAEAAEAAGLKLPELPPVIMEGQIHADRITQRGSEYEDVNVRLAARDGQLEVRGADFRMLDGGFQIAARLGPPDSGPGASGNAPFSVDFQVEDVQSEAFLERFTAFRDHVSGSLRLVGTLAMELDGHLLPEPATLNGGGDIAVIGGQLANWSIVRALGEQLGIARFDTIGFEDWNGRFDIVGSQIVLQETELEGGDLSVRAAGSFDLSGQLALAGTVYLDPSVTARVSGPYASTLVSAVGGDDGRVPVGVRISGTARDASVALDVSEAGRRLADQARQEAEAQARDLVEGAAERVIGTERIPPLDSPAAALDSARQQAEDAVVGRLRGLLPGSRPADDTADQADAGQPAGDDAVPEGTESDSADANAADPSPR